MASAKKLLEGVQEHLDTDETILAHLTGVFESDGWRKEGILVATETRVVFYAKKAFGYDLEVIPLSHIVRIECGQELMGHHVKLFANGYRIQMFWINGHDVQAFVEAVRERIGPPTASASPTDIAERIRVLNALRQEGLLTEDEFAARKARLLNTLTG